MINLYHGDNAHVCYNQLAPESIDTLFCDPPYNIQNGENKGIQYTTSQAMIDKNWSPVYAEYDFIDDYWSFTYRWLLAARYVMKRNASIFITGTHHNIHHIGIALKDLGFYIVQEIAWYKPNAMPNLAMTSMVQAVEWVIWARREQKHSHYYDKEAAKRYNSGKNLKTMWEIPKPSDKGVKYPGRKPVALVYRCLDIATKKQNSITCLDMFAGSGTTGQAFNELCAHYTIDGTCTLIDRDENAIQVTKQRLGV